MISDVILKAPQGCQAQQQLETFQSLEALELVDLVGRGNVLSTDQCRKNTSSGRILNRILAARAEFGSTGVRPLIYCGGGFCATFRLGKEPSVAPLLH